MTLREEIQILSEGIFNKKVYDKKDFYTEKELLDSGKPVVYQVWFDTNYGSIHSFHFKTEEIANAFLSNLRRKKLKRFDGIIALSGKPKPVLKTNKIRTYYDEFGNKDRT